MSHTCRGQKWENGVFPQKSGVVRKKCSLKKWSFFRKNWIFPQKSGGSSKNGVFPQKVEFLEKKWSFSRKVEFSQES